MQSALPGNRDSARSLALLFDVISTSTLPLRFSLWLRNNRVAPLQTVTSTEDTLLLNMDQLMRK